LAKVNIPFAFQMGTQTLPAGMYQIDRDSGHLVLLRGPGKAAGFVNMHDAIRFRPAAQGTIVFDRYGDKYYLHQIWTAGSTNGLECSKSRAEKESLQAINIQAPGSTEVAFNSIPQR
jgi:hypothetical protein